MSHSPYEPEGTGRAVDPDPIAYEVSPGTAYAETYTAPVEDLYAPVTGTQTSSTDDATSVGDVKDTAADQGRRVADTAKEQAGQVKDTAVEQGQKVAGVAKDEAVQVKDQAVGSIKSIVGQGRTELTSQIGTSQNRIAEYVHSLSDELGTLASGGGDGTGPLADLAHRGARTGGELSHWLSEHEPADVLAEVTRFARRRPWAFLGASLVAGVVVGRVTRSLAAEAKDEHDAQQQVDSTPALAGPDYAAPLSTPAAPVGYETTRYATTPAVEDGSTGYPETTGGYAPGYVPTDLPENPAPQTWTGGAR
ncbi:MAG TPA: hypothetical protein VGC37_05155 [Friedmanniella sp.]